MKQQIHISQQVFYFGLSLMLLTGILSAAGWVTSGNTVLTLTLAGGLVSLAARLWHHWVWRAVRQRDAFADSADAPFGLLRDSRLKPRRRVLT